jgi:hypothetical protein
VPAKAGIQNCFIELGSRLRGNDKTAVLQQFPKEKSRESTR